MLVVGLTGGIATGKSTVSKLLQHHGLPVVDADILARQVVEPGQTAYNKVVSYFGTSILHPDGTINRPKLGEIIFNDEVKRRKLNSFVHPAVRWAMVKEVLKHWLRGERICIVDVPLLVEGGLWRYVGRVVVVYCSRDLQLHRLMTRDRSTREAALSRLNSQLPIADKLEYADHVIDNSGPLTSLDEQISSLVSRWKREVDWTWRISWLLPPLGLGLAFWCLFWRTLRGSKRRRRRRHAETKTGIALEGEERELRSQ